jgi:hypothetical protein
VFGRLESEGVATDQEETRKKREEEIGEHEW